MPLDFIDEAPFLQYDYPLFSWEDFPRSREALEPGKSVEGFETKCWDAMVVKMEDVAIALEHSWDYVPYFPYGESKIFTAAMFNAMRWAMWVITPWIVDYYDAHPGDPLKAAQIESVAEDLNRILEFARGTMKLLKLHVPHNGTTTIAAAANVLGSVSIKTDPYTTGKTTSSIHLNNLPSIPIPTNCRGFSRENVKILPCASARIVIDQLQKTNLSLIMEKKSPAHVAAEAKGRSISNACILMTSKTEFLSNSISRTLANAGIITSLVLAAAVQYAGRSFQKTQVYVNPGLLTRSETVSRTRIETNMDTALPAPADCVPLIGRSVINTEISGMESIKMGRVDHSGKSDPKAEFIIRQAAQAAFVASGRSSVSIESHVHNALPAETDQVLHTTNEVNLVTKTVRPAWAEIDSFGKGIVDVSLLEAVIVTVQESSRTQKACSAELLESADAAAKTIAFGKTSCEAAIWLLPLLPDSKTLYIRQTYKEAIKIGDTLYVDEWPDQGLTDDGTLFLWKLFDTVLQVGNTLYIGSMPNTGMTGSDTLLIWDVEQEPVQTLTLLEVF